MSSRKANLDGGDVNRYFTGLGADGKERLKQLANKQGVGAEQDRHASHFGLDEQKIHQFKNALFSRKGLGAEQDVHGGHFTLGHDGMQHVKRLAKTKGVGAEQDRYDGHFGMSDATAQSVKDKIVEGVQNTTSRFG